MRQALQTLVEALFRVLFTYECIGEEKIPASGPAVIASNHPSYLDPLLLSLQVRRPIHFMAWDALFKVPLVGASAASARPVDVRRAGPLAYEQRWSGRPATCRIFPGASGRGRDGGSGAARGRGPSGWETVAPGPATIAGASRAWPHSVVARPARIRVRFHYPRSGPWRAARNEALPPCSLSCGAG